MSIKKIEAASSSGIEWPADLPADMSGESVVRPVSLPVDEPGEQVYVRVATKKLLVRSKAKELAAVLLNLLTR